jgi:predicted phosphoribosyltransferase
VIARPQPASHAAERALAPPSFADREEAARQLAERLLAYRGMDPLVLGIPRGAVPMARVIAQQLGGELDVVLVRKLRAPLQPELAIGAVNESGWLYLAGQGYRHGVSDSYLATERRDQMQTIRERRARYAQVRPAAVTAGRVVIVVDDGLATGATMIAALQGLRQSKPAKLVCAVPVAPADTLGRVADLADEVLCLHQPTDFEAVGQYYRHFPQVSDDEVLTILRQSAPVSTPVSTPPPAASRPQAQAPAR